MKRIYYLHDQGNHPIVTVGVFKDEKGIDFARTISVYGEGEDRPLNKAQARDIVTTRFENAEEILKRDSYVNEIYPRRVEDIYYRLSNVRNTSKGVEILFGDSVAAQQSILKIDLEAVPTDFEKHLLRIDTE
jgi:hypothetical protein